MGEDRIHVVFGIGKVGNPLSARLFNLGLPVRGCRGKVIGVP